MGSSTAVIGEVDNLDLELRRNADTAFSVEWYADEAQTQPIPFASAVGQVREGDTETAALVLDLAPYLTVQDNIITCVVPKEAVADLPELENGSWDLIATTITNEDRALLEGVATIVRGTTR